MPDQNLHAVVKNRAVVSWKEKRDSERRRALVRWSNLVMMWEPQRDDRILELQKASPEHRLDVLETYMARKAPATMLKRAFSLFGLIKWRIVTASNSLVPKLTCSTSCPKPRVEGQPCLNSEVLWRR